MSEDIPKRLDALPWSRWHALVLGVLAVTWLLDGLEGSLGGSLAGALKSHDGLSLTDAQLGLSSSVYLIGAVLGALFFGYLADRYGRRKLFYATLILYLCATTATGFSWDLWSFTLFRALTGAGIGGEYAAINSAVDELTPARMRGRIDIWINGTFWLGILLGSVVSTTLLSSHVLSNGLRWRVAFCSGLPIGLVVLFLRRYVPESPRWLLSRGRRAEAQSVMVLVESEVCGIRKRPIAGAGEKDSNAPYNIGVPSIWTLFGRTYRTRALLCLALMAAQALFYNSVFFSLPLALLRYYGVAAEHVGYYFIPIAITNFAGPAMLGWFFDSVGRKPMISATYILSGAVLLGSSWLFLQGRLSVSSQVAWWCATFFFASCAASSAYLTVSELFPQGVRASSIAIFYALGTLIGGTAGPLVFGHLIGDASRTSLFFGYVAGAAGMMSAGMAQAIWGIASEGRPLETLVAEGAIS